MSSFQEVESRGSRARNLNFVERLVQEEKKQLRYEEFQRLSNDEFRALSRKERIKKFVEEAKCLVLPVTVNSERVNLHVEALMIMLFDAKHFALLTDEEISLLLGHVTTLMSNPSAPVNHVLHANGIGGKLRKMVVEPRLSSETRATVLDLMKLCSIDLFDTDTPSMLKTIWEQYVKNLSTVNSYLTYHYVVYLRKVLTAMHLTNTNTPESDEIISNACTSLSRLFIRCMVEENPVDCMVTLVAKTLMMFIETLHPTRQWEKVIPYLKSTLVTIADTAMVLVQESKISASTQLNCLLLWNTLLRREDVAHHLTTPMCLATVGGLLQHKAAATDSAWSICLLSALIRICQCSGDYGRRLVIQDKKVMDYVQSLLQPSPATTDADLTESAALLMCALANESYACNELAQHHTGLLLSCVEMTRTSPNQSFLVLEVASMCRRVHHFTRSRAFITKVSESPGFAEFVQLFVSTHKADSDIFCSEREDDDEEEPKPSRGYKRKGEDEEEPCCNTKKVIHLDRTIEEIVDIVIED